MEESPRRLGEENIDDSSESDITPKKRRSSQDFLDRWRRFSSKDTGVEHSLLKAEQAKDNNEDDDENENLSTSAKKRLRRLRRLGLSSYLPQKKEIVEETRPQLPTERPTLEEDSGEVHSTTEHSVDVDPRLTVEAPIGPSGTTTERDELPRARVEDKDGVQPDEPELSHLEDDALFVDQPTSIESGIEVPETESIEAILHRQDHSAELHQYRSEHDRNDQSTTAYVEPVTKPENVYQSAPVGGLLAVDLMNYRIAKKRDSKNKKLHEKQHEQIKRDQLKENDAIKARIARTELQQNRQQGSLESVKNKTEHQGVATKNNIIYNRTEAPKEQNSVKKIEHIPAAISTSETRYDTPGYKSKSAVDTPRNFENTLQRVHEAEKGKISSEFQFERRHEVMDEPGGGKAYSTSADSVYGTTGQHYGPSKSTTGVDARTSTDSTIHHRDGLVQPVYKQAAITGFWGAVAGIIAFIIMYMLAS